MSPRRLVTSLALALALSPTSARAWDPSTTHSQMTRRAVGASAVHLHWMDGSDLRRGIFSAVRLDPAQLSEDMRRRVLVAMQHAHADSGAAGLGGPGACPGASAPVSTRARCVEGDQWELSALGWIQLGMVAELDPRDRILHHFADRQDPQAAKWTDRTLPRAVLRAEFRRSGGSLSESLTGSAFSGTAPSALAWVEDKQDPWAPRQALLRLRDASLAADPTARDHALAEGLLGIGALLHVVQDLSVPAHARGDITAFFSPLSGTAGDRGLPLQEFVRVEYGRTRLPTALALGPRATTRGVVLSRTLRGHLLGDEDFGGLIPMAGHRFLSETSLPEPTGLPPDSTAQEAAAFLLADAALDPVETEGAKLSPWPAAAGYLLSAEGRPLAAFEADTVGQVRLYLDRRVYRDQAGHLIPLGVEVSRSVLDLLLPAFAPTDRVSGSDVLALDLREWNYERPGLQVLVEDALGQRRVVRRVTLRPGQRNRITAGIPKVADNERVVLVLLGESGGLPVTAEKVWVDRPDAPAVTIPTPTDETDETDDPDDTDETADTPTPPDGDEPVAPATDPAPAAKPAPKVPAGVVPSTPAEPSPAAPRGPAIPTKRAAPEPDADEPDADDPDAD
jgi:hypothetical protein